MMITEPGYFDTKASQAWRQVGGPEGADLTAIAGWARAAKTVDQRNIGILVDEAGRVVAQTECVRGTDGYTTWIVRDCDVAAEAQGRRVLDVEDVIERAAGGQAVHLRFWQLCQGAGR